METDERAEERAVAHARLAAEREQLRVRRTELQARSPHAFADDEAAEEAEAPASHDRTTSRKARLEALRSRADCARDARRVAAASSIVVALDARGREMLTLGSGCEPGAGSTGVVMMEWERGYMEACVEALCVRRGEAVLEVGYGLGFSAAALQLKQPGTHVVLECAPLVIARCEAWAATRAGASCAKATWQQALAHRGCDGPLQHHASFQAVFFDDFPLVRDAPTLAANASRWTTFLRAVAPKLAHGARLTGYLADASALATLPRGFTLAGVSTFKVRPPEDCPYHAPGEDECLVPLIVYSHP